MKDKKEPIVLDLDIFIHLMTSAYREGFKAGAGKNIQRLENDCASAVSQFRFGMADMLMREEPVRRGLSFRIGGDEFVTLFEGEEEETLLRELEVFHMAGAQAEVNGEPVTFAYGVASYDPALDKGSLHNTLSQADAHMYRFKKAARGES